MVRKKSKSVYATSPLRIPRRVPLAARNAAGYPGPEGPEGSAVGAYAHPHAADLLREKEQQYRNIFESTSDGIVINDPDDHVIDANPAFCRMHGFTREELIGADPSIFIHPDSHATFEDYKRAMAEGRDFEARAVDIRKDGTPFHVEVHGSPVMFRGMKCAMGVVRDISDQVAAYSLLEQRVEERTRALSALLDVSRNVAYEGSLRTILDGLARNVVEATGAEACAVVLIDERGKSVYGGVYGLPDGYTEADAEAVRRREGRGLVSQVVRDRTSLVLRNARSTLLAVPEYQPLHPYLVQVPWNSIIVTPMFYRGRIVGALTTYYIEGQEPLDTETSFLLAIADQAAVAVENARLFAATLDKAALEERQRLARELHDSVSQALFSISLHARTARTLLTRDPERVAEPLEHISSLAQAGMAEMRALIFELRPESLETEGLVAALNKQVAALRARHDIEVRVHLCDEPDISIEAKEVLYRIAQESMHNTVKHARAHSIDLWLECGGSKVRIEVRDDGAGFDANGSFPGHLGLRSMRERAERLGGTFVIASAPGSGTCIRVELPA